MGNWYLLRNQTRYGPYSWQDLCRHIHPRDLVWGPESTGWIPASQVPGLVGQTGIQSAQKAQAHTSPNHPAASRPARSRKKSKGLIALIMTGSLLFFFVMPLFLVGRCSRKPPERMAFPLEFQINASNERFFLEPDTYELLMASGPFYAGLPLPFDQLNGFEQARAAKVSSVMRLAEELIVTVRDLEADIEAARMALFDVFDNLTDEPGIAVLALPSVAWQANLQSESEWLAAVLDALAEHEVTDAYVRAQLDYLYVVSAIEYAALHARSMDHLMAVSALILIENESQGSARIRTHLDQLDRHMAGTDAIAARADNLFILTEQIAAGLDQLNTADHYLAADIMQFISSQVAPLRDKLNRPVSRERLSLEEMDIIHEYLDAFEFVSRQLLDDLDLPLDSNTRAYPAWSGAVYADEDTPMLSQRALDALFEHEEIAAERKRQRPFRTKLWEGTKSVVRGTVKHTRDIAGTTADLLGETIGSASRIGFGLYYGNEWSDIRNDVTRNFNRISENYINGVSGAATFRQANTYFDLVEKKAGEGWQALGEKAFGDTWPAQALGAMGKMSAGAFTALGQGISRIANHESTAMDVAQGSMEIGLSMIGGSSSVFKASQATRIISGQKMLRSASYLARNPRIGVNTAVRMTQGLADAGIRNMRNVRISSLMSATWQGLRQKVPRRLSVLPRMNYRANMHTIYREAINLGHFSLRSAFTEPGKVATQYAGYAIDFFDMYLNGLADDLLTDAVVKAVEWMTASPGVSAGQIETEMVSRVEDSLEQKAFELAARLINRQYPDLDPLLRQERLMHADDLLLEIDALIEQIRQENRAALSEHAFDVQIRRSGTDYLPPVSAINLQLYQLTEIEIGSDFDFAVRIANLPETVVDVAVTWHITQTDFTLTGRHQWHQALAVSEGAAVSYLSGRFTKPGPQYLEVLFTDTSGDEPVPLSSVSLVAHVISIDRILRFTESGSQPFIPASEAAIPGERLRFQIIPPIGSAAGYSYYWAMGDGAEYITAEPVLDHTYQVPGQYPIIVWLADANGLFLSVDQMSLTVAEADSDGVPPPDETAPDRTDGHDISGSELIGEWVFEARTVAVSDPEIYDYFFPDPVYYFEMTIRAGRGDRLEAEVNGTTGVVVYSGQHFTLVFEDHNRTDTMTGTINRDADGFVIRGKGLTEGEALLTGPYWARTEFTARRER